MSEPFFITTDRGNVIPWSTMIAFKEGDKSQVLAQDQFGTGESNLVQPPYDMVSLIQLLEINTWHKRCVSVMAQDIAGGGWTLTSTSGSEELTAEEKEVESFFTVNDDAVMVDAETDLEATGVCAIEIVRDQMAADGKPLLMSHIPVQTIRPEKSGNKFMQKRGTKKRWFKRFGYDKDINKSDGTEHELGSLSPEQRASEVLWGKLFSGRSDFYGIAPITPALGAVQGMLSLRDYNIKFFENYGIPSYAVYISGNYDLGQKKRFRLEADKSGTIGEVWDPEKIADGWHEINFQYTVIQAVKDGLAQTVTNPHAPMVFAVPSKDEEGRMEIKFVPLSVEVKDASFRMYRKDNRDEVIVAHGVPSYRIGLVEVGALGGNVAVESTRIYRDSVIRPRKRRLSEQLTRTIIRDGFGVETLTFKFNDLDLAEEDHEREIAEFLFERGAMRPVDLMRNFGERFGLVIPTEEEQPALYQYYIGGQPVNAPADGDVVGAVKGLKADLFNLAVKGALDDKAA